MLTEADALSQLIPPGKIRPGKPLGGVIQIGITRNCDKACFGCTQGANLRGKNGFMTAHQFDKACRSLREYFGVVGVFGGNPCLHPEFPMLCGILRRHIPRERRGLWTNRVHGHGAVCADTFNPAVSNINVHLDQVAADEVRESWPDAKIWGEHQDSRHSPPFVAMQDVIANEAQRWKLIAGCDINRHWSAEIVVFRGELRGFFCELAAAQAVLHQSEPEYPDLGMAVEPGWWRRPMSDFAEQARYHCHACGVPLRGHGELAQNTDPAAYEQVSKTHEAIYTPKRRGRAVRVITRLAELGSPLPTVVDYLGNAR